LSARGFLLLRRGGLLWGVANAAIEGLALRGGGFFVALAGTTLVADEILGVVDDLVVRRTAPALRRFWPDTAAGMAVHGDEPLVVVDPLRPPRLLRLENGDA
jgi:hypothetical protein